MLAIKISVKSIRRPYWNMCLKFAHRLCESAQRLPDNFIICILSLACVWTRRSTHGTRAVVLCSLWGWLFDTRWEHASENVRLLTCCVFQIPNNNIYRDRSLTSIDIKKEPFLRHEYKLIRVTRCVNCLNIFCNFNSVYWAFKPSISLLL